MTADGENNDTGGPDAENEEDLVGMYEQPPVGGDDDGDTDTDGPSVNLDAPVGEDTADPETATGIFYVKYATDVSVTLHEVDTGQIFTLIENPGVEDHDIIEASLVAQPPMEVSYLVEDLEDHYTVPVETSPEPPTRQVQEIADDMDDMEAVAIDREGEGEIHILRVDPDNVTQTAEELHEDEMTYKNAARYGIDRVEIRTDERGVVSVRYLP